MKQINTFLDRFEAPKLSDTEIVLRKKEITEPDLCSAIKSMENNKSHFNYGLTKEFYKIFWNKIIHLYFKCIKHTKY